MCENNKMLVATPLQPPMTEHGKPRVISEVKKATPRTPFEHSQPRISGELLQWDESEGIWRRKRVVVRGGALHVAGHVRVALRRLHLRPGDKARSFALYDTACDSRPIAVFQASNDREYDTWVKTIAIELMRQTPLDAIKYLDIMGLISPSNSEISIRPRRSSSSECSDSTLGSPTFSTGRRCNSEAQLDEPNNMKYNLYSSSDEDYNSNNWKISNGSSCEDCRSARRTARRALFKDDDVFKYQDNTFENNAMNDEYKNKDEYQKFGLGEYQNVRAEMRQCDYIDAKSEKLSNGSVDCIDGLVKNGVNLRNTKHNKRIEHRIVTKDILDQMDSIFSDLDKVEIIPKDVTKHQGTYVQDNTRNKSLSENNINMYDFNSNVKTVEMMQRVGRDRTRRTGNINQKDINRNGTTENKNGDSEVIGSSIKRTDFGTIGYSRVYNVREGIQLKTYDLKSINAALDKFSSNRKHDVENRKKLREHESRRKEKEENLKNLSAKCETDILKNLSTKWSSDNNVIELKNTKNVLEHKPSTNANTNNKNVEDRTGVSESQPELKKYFTLTDYQSRHSTTNKEPRSLSLSREREIMPLSVSCKPRETQTGNNVNDKRLEPVQSDEQKVEVLLQRCQNSDSYVPVKDKLMLFESLCRLGRRLARSSEDLVSVPTNAVCKRARSMHDLSRCGSTGVREMCKYFETKSEPEKLAIDTENKYNTIAKGYRMVSQTNQVMKNDNGRYIKKNGADNGRRYSYFKQFREGNKIISYV